MTHVAPRETPSSNLQEALAALKRAAVERRFLEDGTPEHARAMELEARLARNVYERAAEIDNDAKHSTGGVRHRI